MQLFRRHKLTTLLLTLCSVWWTSLNSFGQDVGEFFKNDRVWMATLGYTYQNQNILEFGVRRTSLDKTGNPADGQYMLSYMMYSYLIMGGEVTFNQTTQVAPKIGIGYNFMLANINLNFEEYNTNFKDFYPAFVPEIGLSVLGIFQINYGYNVFFSKTNLFGNNNRLSLRVSYFLNDKGWWPWTKKRTDKSGTR